MEKSDENPRHIGFSINKYSKNIQEDQDDEQGILDFGPFFDCITSGQGDFPSLYQTYSNSSCIPEINDILKSTIFVHALAYDSPDLLISALNFLSKYTKFYPETTEEFVLGDPGDTLLSIFQKPPTLYYNDILSILLSFTNIENVIPQSNICETIFGNSNFQDDENIFYFLYACNTLIDFFSKKPKPIKDILLKALFKKICTMYNSQLSPETYTALLKLTLTIIQITYVDADFYNPNGILEIIRQNNTNVIPEIELLSFKILLFSIDLMNLKRIPDEHRNDFFNTLYSYCKKHDILSYVVTRIDDASAEAKTEIIRIITCLMKYTKKVRFFASDEETEFHFCINIDNLEKTIMNDTAQFILEIFDEGSYQDKIACIDYFICVIKAAAPQSVFIKKERKEEEDIEEEDDFDDSESSPLARKFLEKNEVLELIFENLEDIPLSQAYVFLKCVYFLMRYLSSLTSVDGKLNALFSNVMNSDILDQLSSFADQTKFTYQSDVDNYKKGHVADLENFERDPNGPIYHDIFYIITGLLFLVDELDNDSDISLEDDDNPYDIYNKE